MNKPLLVAIPLALAAAIPVSAWFIGNQTRSGLTDYYQQTTATLPYLKVSKRVTAAGVFSSTETTTFEVMGDLTRHLAESMQGNGSAKTAQPLTVTVRHHIQHGPLPGWNAFGAAKVRSEIVWSDEVKKELAKVFGDKSPFEVETLMRFGGGGTSVMRSPSAKGSFPSKVAEARTTQLTWQGAELTVDFTKGMQSFTMRGGMPGVEIVEGTKKMSLQGIKIEGEQKRIFPDDVWLFSGQQRFSIDQISVNGDNNKDAAFKNIQYVFDSILQGDFVDWVLKSKAAEVRIGKENYGPAQYDLSFKHLHARTLANFYRSLMSTMSNPGSGSDAAMAKAMQEQGMELLRRTPEFSIDRISFTSGGQEAEVSANVKLVEFASTAGANPMMLLQKLVAQADLSLPENLFAPSAAATTEAEVDETALRRKMMGAQITQMEEQGYVIREKGKLKAKIEFKAGQLTVNGKLFNPMMQQGSGEDEEAHDNDLPQEPELPETPST